MSYLTPYFLQDTKTFLEAHPALAELLGGVGLIALGYLAVGLLILWRIKFYRPKPIRPKEPKPKVSNLLGELRFIFYLGAMVLACLLGGLAGILVTLVVLGGLYHLLFVGQAWQEVAFVLGLFLFSVFCLWLIGRS